MLQPASRKQRFQPCPPFSLIVTQNFYPTCSFTQLHHKFPASPTWHTRFSIRHDHDYLHDLAFPVRYHVRNRISFRAHVRPFAIKKTPGFTPKSAKPGDHLAKYQSSKKSRNKKSGFPAQNIRRPLLITSAEKLHRTNPPSPASLARSHPARNHLPPSCQKCSR